MEVDELLFADTELGAEHFFFLARAIGSLEPGWTPPIEPAREIMPVTLRVTALLGYPVEPVEVARRLTRLRGNSEGNVLRQRP